MTDKQIIIDDIDVSRCQKQGETIVGITCGNGERIRLANEIITKHKLCKDNPNCIYKQLKRKEQECEELREEKAYTDMACEQFEKQLQSKEQECEELKRALIDDQCFIKISKKCARAYCIDEELRKQLDQFKKSNEELQKENERLNMELAKVYEDIKLSPLCYKCDEEECLRKEIDKLKAEKKELKKVSCKFKSYCTCNTEKFLQTLTEIKPILEFYANSQMGEEQPDRTYHIRLNGGYIMVYDPKPARQALQKLVNVGVENDR